MRIHPSKTAMLLEFSKRGHRFAFVYNDQTAEQVIAILWKFAADPDLPITDDDAAELARDIREKGCRGR